MPRLGADVWPWLLQRRPRLGLAGAAVAACVRLGVFILNGWGVSPNVINCGASDWGTVLLKGKNYSGVPNAELRLNGKKVTACEPTGTLRGGSIVRAPERSPVPAQGLPSSSRCARPMRTTQTRRWRRRHRRS